MSSIESSNNKLDKFLKMKKIAIPTIIILLALLIFGGYLILFNNGKGLLASNESKMWSMVQPVVAKKLKEPSSAEFEDISKVKFFQINDDTYEVIGIVKGKNNFGAMVPENFVATVTTNNGKPIKVTEVLILSNDELKKRTDTAEELEKRVENKQSFLTAEELEEKIKQQPLYVENAIYQDASKFYSGAMLQAVLYNNSEVSIKNAEIAFVAWDKNKLPIEIKSQYSSKGSYFSTLTFDTINLMPQQRYNGRSGDTYYGMRVDENLDVSHLKAIVVSYEDFDGNIWYNPLILDFKNLYENNKLS